jgi:phosphate transport system substrate-binding protein
MFVELMRLAARTRKFMVAMLYVAAAGLSASQAIAETLIVQGSTTFTRRLMDPHKGAIEAASNHEITLIPNKSLPGLIALMEGRAHMAMISSPLESDIAQLKKVMPGLPYERLQQHPVLATRIAVTVHPSNPVRKATLDQVRKIVLGEISNWSEVGGPNVAVRVVLVGGGGGVTTVVESELIKGRLGDAPHIIYVKTPVQLVQVVEQEPGIIGFAQLALTRQRGLPEVVTEQPIEQTLSFVTNGNPTPAMKAVIEAARAVAERVM